MRNYKIYLIRNGLTDGAIEGRYIGHTDEPLNEEGRKQLIDLSTTGYYPEVEGSAPHRGGRYALSLAHPTEER